MNTNGISTTGTVYINNNINTNGILTYDSTNTISTIATINNNFNYKKKYNVLGTDIELYSSTDLEIIIALINTLGYSFYDNLKNTDIGLSIELINLMEEKRIQYNREKNIDNILK
jgi:hypothetical protein